MNLILFTDHYGFLPVLGPIIEDGWLLAIISSERASKKQLKIAHFCKAHHIPFYTVSRSQLHNELPELIKSLAPDIAVMLGFPYRIPAESFSLLPKGFFNIHFSKLPAYKGPAPVFWQLKNGEAIGGITIHQVNGQFDSGPVVMQQDMPIIPGENWGLYHMRCSQVAYGMLCQLINHLQQNEKIECMHPAGFEESYYPRPNVPALTINWEAMPAQEVENLVNACNPVYGGAITTFQQQPLRILEVSPVDSEAFPEATAGEVVHHDHTGLYIQCEDRKLLRINVVALDEIILSGFKLGLMGAQKGVKLGTGTFNYEMAN